MFWSLKAYRRLGKMSGRVGWVARRTGRWGGGGDGEAAMSKHCRQDLMVRLPMVCSAGTLELPARKNIG